MPLEKNKLKFTGVRICSWYLSLKLHCGKNKFNLLDRNEVNKFDSSDIVFFFTFFNSVIGYDINVTG